MKFKIEITLGNDTMRSGQDVSGALSAVADRIDYIGGDLEAAWPTGISGPVMDLNGNRVGEWQLAPGGQD